MPVVGRGDCSHIAGRVGPPKPMGWGGCSCCLGDHRLLPTHPHGQARLGQSAVFAVLSTRLSHGVVPSSCRWVPEAPESAVLLCFPQAGFRRQSPPSGLLCVHQVWELSLLSGDPEATGRPQGQMRSGEASPELTSAATGPAFVSPSLVCTEVAKKAFCGVCYVLD